MNEKFIHPKDQIINIMKRIYEMEMTTLSGGNLSILDEDGNVWITPAGGDKGKLTSEDIVCVKPDGKYEGLQRPSSELAFHKAILESRPDFRAVVHTHSPTLVAYSISGEIPDTRHIAQAYRTCGSVAYAPYALTGSHQLGVNIANTFSQGVDTVLLENHGVVCGGKTLLEAYQRMEALDFCARSLVNANRLNSEKLILNPDLETYLERQQDLPEFDIENHPEREVQLRGDIVDIIQRSCKRQLMNSTQGIVSARLDDNSFLIVPDHVDRFNITQDDMVLIKDQKRERGKNASRSVDLHEIIYKTNPQVGSVIMAQSPAAMTYAITSEPFESRTIPESYIMLREVVSVGLEVRYNAPEEIAQLILNDHPVLMVENDCVLVTGKTILEAFDRLEVLEFTAKSLLKAMSLGECKPIDPDRIKELENKFFTQ